MKRLAESKASEENAVSIVVTVHFSEYFKWIWAPGFVLKYGAFWRFISFTCMEIEFQQIFVTYVWL